MKISPLKVGGRTIKTVAAVFLCFLVDTVRNSNTAFYAAIAAILCIQRTPKDSWREALNREIATIIGGVWGMSILLIPLINFSVLIKQEKGTFLMCVVFLCITVTHGNDESPLAFGLNRITDTTVGIMIALLINQIPVAEQKVSTPI